MIQNLVAGGLAGMVCAIGGAIKDAPHEGFKPSTFLRSPLVGLACGAATIPLTDNALLAFCVAGYFERATVEAWKIVRRQTPGKHLWRYSEWPALWSGQEPIEQKPGTPPESP